MKRFAIDYEGFIYVDADSENDAMNLAMDILSTAHPYDSFGGDWEIKNIEQVPDDEGR